MGVVGCGDSGQNHVPSCRLPLALEWAPAPTFIGMTGAQPLRTETLTTTEVAATTGLSADTLRYYEKAGLIDPIGRSAGGQRRYAGTSLNWIAFLMRLRRTGMSIADMQRFAELRRGGEATVAARLELLRTHQARLAERIFQLRPTVVR